MKRAVVALLALGLLQAVLAEPPAAPAKAGKFPERKWFNEDEGYAEALALQKETGADILIYAAQYAPPDRKGLSSWFERKGLQDNRVVEGLKPYLKVKVTLPLNNKEEEVFAKLKLSGGPTLHVQQTNGWSSRINPFDWPGGKPELKKPEDLLMDIRSRSGPRYQEAPEKD